MQTCKNGLTTAMLNVVEDGAVGILYGSQPCQWLDKCPPIECVPLGTQLREINKGRSHAPAFIVLTLILIINSVCSLRKPDSGCLVPKNSR